MLSNTLRLNFCYLNVIPILHPRYHLKVIRHILKIKHTNKCVCIHEIIRLIIMKMTKMKKNHIDTTKVDLGLDMDTNIVNIKSILV